MTNHMEAAVKAALMWMPHLPSLSVEEHSAAAEEMLTAALPHLRAMIAEEAANSWIPHRDELAQAIASGYEPDHPVPNRHDYKATDSVLRLLTAARNAEGIQA